MFVVEQVLNLAHHTEEAAKYAVQGEDSNRKQNAHHVKMIIVEPQCIHLQ